MEVKGSSPGMKLKGVAAPPRKVNLFVGRLDPDTTSDDVVLHIDHIIGKASNVDAVEIPHCQASNGYKGFKVCVPAETVSMIMQCDKWPTHVAVRKFYPPKVATSVKDKLARSTSVDDIRTVK